MTTGELFLLQEEPFVSLWSLKMRIFGFWTDRDWSQKSYYGNNTKGAFVSVVMNIYGAKFQMFPEMSFIQFLQLLQLLICIIEKR